MAHPAYLREKARELRIKKKLSLLEIADRLALPKTTIFYWIRDLPDPEIKHRDTAGRARARAKGNRSMQQKYARIRKEAYDRGRQEFAGLSTDPTFRDFVCMYIGEGYKKTRNVVAIANSDPAVIKLGDRWIRALTSSRVSYTFQHHADQDPAELIAFWSAELAVDPKLFRFMRKSNSGSLKGRNWRSKHAVLTVVCNDTCLRARLQAWIDEVREGWLDSPHGA